MFLGRYFGWQQTGPLEGVVDVAHVVAVVEDYDDEDSEEQDESFDEDVDVTLPTYSVNIRKQNNEEVTNHDLRLVNAYFKEVSTETLLTPLEEIQIAAKIRCAESGAVTTRGKIAVLIGKTLPDDSDKLKM